MYFEQVESLLALLSTCRQGDWEAWLERFENEIKCFFAADLLSNARLMPLHLAQMNELEKKKPFHMELPQGWQLCNYNVRNPISLFNVQNFVQKIKDLMGLFGSVGVAQDGAVLDRLVITTPYVTRIVKRKNQQSFPSGTFSIPLAEHCQLSGNAGV